MPAEPSAAAATTQETVQIPPHPRILRALAEIDFDHWQCIAELVDNGFDEFLEIQRTGASWDESFRVHVALPQQASGRIVVSDNGRGMALEQIKNAVSAGYSSNDPVSKLGLFGMGFNVSTARLGGVTTFLSTRAGDPEWVGVRIDVRDMDADFTVPVVRVPKADAAEHGTRIEIDELTLGKFYTRPGNRSRLRAQLGGIYSHVLDERGYELVVDTTAVTPYRHCVWSADRKVVRSGEEVPARISIDEELPPMKVCRDCAQWQSTDNDTCQQCDSPRLVERERRVHGWLGVARELDSKEFGIDFLRNGRKILRFDRSLFEWSDPDDASGAPLPEYPLEVPYNRGRLVGEIHLDHVPVLYTKDAFDFNDRAWKTAVRLLRGETSLLPNTAKARGDAPNESPLARLHKGFRRNDPGRNYLTVGDGNTRKDTTDWVAKFHDGDPEYQDDTKWWEAAVEHDRVKAEEAAEKERRRLERERSDRGEREDPTEEFFDPDEDKKGAPEDESPTPTPAPSPPRPLTEQERIEQYEHAGRAMPQLKGEYTAKGVGARPVPLDAVGVRGVAVVDAAGDRVPVLLAPRPKGAFTAFVDLDHSLFDSYDDEPEDLVLFSLAQQLIVRSKSSIPLAAVYAELKDRYLHQRAISAGTLQAEASQLLADLQGRMVALVSDDPSRPWHKALADHERALTRERIADALRTANVDAALHSGEYLPLVPATAVPRIVSEWPEAFLDHRLFGRPYRGLEAAAQQQALGRIVGYLNDAAWLASSPVGATREELVRARLSLQLLPDELAAGGNSD